MNEDISYTYKPAYETTLFPNNGGGITIEQKSDFCDEPCISLTTHQARWLAERLVELADSIDSCASINEEQGA